MTPLNDIVEAGVDPGGDQRALAMTVGRVATAIYCGTMFA
jgi:hypothetical protein